MKRLFEFFVASLLMALFVYAESPAETFPFGSNSQNNINGTSAAVLRKGSFTMQLQPQLAGALLSELSTAGMGIDSVPVVGSGNDQPALFDVLGGSGSLAGTGEAVRFSFAQPGVLTGIDFDGVKDESLEYFILESTGGVRVNFFDSAANLTIPNAVDAAVLAGAVTGAVVYLLEINDAIDDEAQNLSISFAAGQEFTLTFNALGPEFRPILASNGARFQSITVQSVPEPCDVAMTIGLGLAYCIATVRRRR
jgi:hypothetical protein